MMYYYYNPFYSPQIQPSYSYAPTSSHNQNLKNNNIIHNRKSTHSVKNDVHPKKEKNDASFSDNTVLFEILGIKLYFDDLLIICLIFFLYTEGVNDQILFIALILLLLS